MRPSQGFQSPITNHAASDFYLSHSRASGPTAAFGSAGHLKEILGSGFEMIRISQCESPRVFSSFMIKKGQSGDQLMITIEENFSIIQKLLVSAILFPVRDSLGDTGSLLLAAPRKSFAGPGAKVSGPGPYSTP